jgi:hypothetical protein
MSLEERGLFRTLCDLMLINGGSIRNNAKWIAAHGGISIHTVRARLPGLLLTSSLLAADEKLTCSSVGAALVASYNSLKDKGTRGSTRARKESSLPLQEEKIPKPKADDAARASLGGGSSPPSAQNEHEKVVQLHPTPRYPGCEERWQSCEHRWQAGRTICQPECRPQIPGYRPYDEEELTHG